MTLFTGFPPVCSWVAFSSLRCLTGLLYFDARMSHLSWSWLIIRQAHDFGLVSAGGASGHSSELGLTVWSSLPLIMC